MNNFTSMLRNDLYDSLHFEETNSIQFETVKQFRKKHDSHWDSMCAIHSRYIMLNQFVIAIFKHSTIQFLILFKNQLKVEHIRLQSRKLDDDLFNEWKNENVVKSEKANQLPSTTPNTL